MRTSRLPRATVAAITSLLVTAASSALAGPTDALLSTAERPDHRAPAADDAHAQTALPETPPLPDGMTLDDVLDQAASPPPEHYPEPVPDDDIRMFALFDQLEYRLATGDGGDEFGWEAAGWLGYDFDRLWWKSEGEALFEGQDNGEAETQLLYSRMVTAFWHAQIGARYANEWASGGDYEDTWSAAISLLGLAPYKFEMDHSLYLSEQGDLSFESETEYDLRVTQRLVLQPRLELSVYAQDIPERNIGAGFSDLSLDLRVRYEIVRRVAPYAGLRYRVLLGESANRTQAAGGDTAELLMLAGIRLAL